MQSKAMWAQFGLGGLTHTQIHTHTHTHTLMVDRHGGEMDDDVFLLLKQTWPLFLGQSTLREI